MTAYGRPKLNTTKSNRSKSWLSKISSLFVDIFFGPSHIQLTGFGAHVVAEKVSGAGRRNCRNASRRWQMAFKFVDDFVDG